MYDKLTICTRKENDNGGFNYYRIEFNFGTMQNKDKAEDSYSPTIFTEITKQEYEDKTPYKKGSALSFEELVDHYSRINASDDVIDNIKRYINISCK